MKSNKKKSQKCEKELLEYLCNHFKKQINIASDELEEFFWNNGPPHFKIKKINNMEEISFKNYSRRQLKNAIENYNKKIRLNSKYFENY